MEVPAGRGTEPDTSTIVAIAAVSWPAIARLVRGEFIGLAQREFVLAARLAGESPAALVRRQILPHVWPPLAVLAALMVATAILTESALSFLGLGIQPPAADWGGMVKDNKGGVIFGVSAALYPGLAIALLAICVNLVVDWLLNRTASLRGGR